MSWAQEEWKSGLASNVLAKITELEDSVEIFTKDRKSLQFQVESLQASLENAKVSEQETKKEIQVVEKSMGELLTDLEERTSQLEKAKSTMKEKDVMILNLTNELANVKKERDSEKEERLKTERDFDKEQQRLLEQISNLDSLNQQLQKNTKDPDLFQQNESMRQDLEAGLVQMNRLREELIKMKEERDLERVERAKLQTKLEEIEKNEECRNKENTEFIRRNVELEETNTRLQSKIDNEKHKNSSIGQAQKQELDDLRQNLANIQKQLQESEKERDDVLDRLKDEREMFIESEAKMKREVEVLKQEVEEKTLFWQEEREQFLKAEMEMNVELEGLRGEAKKLVERSEEQMTVMVEQELGQENTEAAVDALESQVDNLRRKNSKLVRQNSDLLDEISKEQEQRSDIEETMKGDIDSIRICLQTKIDELQRNNSELQGKFKSEREVKRSLQKEADELNKELDALNDVLSKERELRKKAENDNEDIKREQEYWIKFGSIESKDSHYEEKGNLSKLVKKRSERWNVEVFELKKKISELEKMNRELTKDLDKKMSSVGTLRHEFECKLKEDVQKSSADRSTSTDTTPKRHGLSLSFSCYSNTPVRKASSRRLDTAHEGSNDQIISEKDNQIQQLRREVQAAKDEKDKNQKKYEMNLNVMENEVSLMKQQLQAKDEQITCMTVKRDKRPDALKQDKHLKTLSNAAAKDSGVEIQNQSAAGMRFKTIDDLKELVVEFEKESSELQEIIDESKEAIFELTKALQGSEEVFLVDSKDSSDVKNTIKRADTEESCESGREKLVRSEQPSEKQSYVLSRVSLNDIDVTAVLSKLRIAVSQLESRLDKVQTEKQQMEAKIDSIKYSDGKLTGNTLESKSSRKLNNGKVAKKQALAEEEHVLELKSSRSAVIEIARKRDATIIDGTIDDIAHEENKKYRDENIFKHSNRCKVLWQQLCDANASLSRYQHEINNQRYLYNKHLAECQDKVDQAESVEKSIAEVGSLAKEQFQKQEFVIANLEEKILNEQKSSEMLQMRVDDSKFELEEAQRRNAELCEKLEENKSLLYKHHKSNEKKLDAIMNYLKDDIIGQFKQVIEADVNRGDVMGVSPTSYKSSTQYNYSRGNSRNTSFHSPEANIEAEIASKKACGRGRNLEEQAYRIAAHGYKTIDEFEKMKGRMNGMQENVKTLIGAIDQLQREKSKLQDERERLVDRIHSREEEVRKAESRVEKERRKVKENEVEFQSEMDALRVQLLEVYKEFEENCDNVKRKDIELLNKTKQIKLLTAEWKEAEQKLKNQLESLRNENQTLWAENGELRVELERSKSSVDDFVRKMRNAEEQLSYLYQKLSNLDRIFYDCKQKSLYR